MKKSVSILILLAGLLFMFAGCRQGNYKSLSVGEFENILGQEGMQLVDTRTGVEYSESYIPGAININVMDISFRDLADSALRKDRPVAVYCRSGKRSKKAAEILSQSGYTVYELDKGFNSWMQAGKKTAK